ncbi:MAG TPA: hypothetical protein VH280_04925 [Verrucomicrobiae bacterium]|nr:hypothetical protein [Verrucomicrobiae bacterium]
MRKKGVTKNQKKSQKKTKHAGVLMQKCAKNGKGSRAVAARARDHLLWSLVRLGPSRSDLPQFWPRLIAGFCGSGPNNSKPLKRLKALLVRSFHRAKATVLMRGSTIKNFEYLNPPTLFVSASGHPSFVTSTFLPPLEAVLALSADRSSYFAIFLEIR